jgi:exoribonuclease R
MTSSSKSSVIFANEHQKDCYTQRQSDETVVHWHQRLTLYVVMWYRNHMDMNGLNHKPIILITHDAQCYASLKSSPSVKVLSLGEFLDEYHAQCSNVYQLYLSVVNLLQETVSDVNEGISTYTKHWDSARIDEAISKGQVVAGKLRVNRYHPREEAFVTPLSSTWQSDIVTHPLHNDIFISGMIDRNRGLNGDTVVVQLYSRDKWKGQSKQLPSNVNEEASHDGSCDQVIPTGRVVGILIRCNRDIVASFPVS